MSTRREKLLQKIDPKLLANTPKLSCGENSVIELDSREDTLKPGAKDLMLRFFKKQELFFKSISTDEGIELTDANYNESYRICKSISERLSLPFNHDGAFRVDKPGKKLQELKKKLEEKMSAKRNEDYRKRISDYNKWLSEQNQKEGKEDSVDEEEFSEDEKGGDGNSEKEGDENPNHNQMNDAQKNSDEQSLNGNDEIDKMKLINNSEECNDVICTKSSTVQSDVLESNSNSCAATDDLQEVSKENSSTAENLDLGDNNDSNSDESSLIPPYQPPGGGTLSSALEQSQSTQGLPQNLMSPLRFLMNDSQNLRNDIGANSQESLGDDKNNFFPMDKPQLFSLQNGSQSYNLNDAFEFCSGKFPGDVNSQKLSGNFDMEKKNSFNEDCSDGEEADDESENNCDEDDVSDVDNDDDNDNDENEDDDDDDEDEDDEENVNQSDDNIDETNASKFKKRIIMFDESDDESKEDAEGDNDKGDDENELSKNGRIISDDEDENYKSSEKNNRKTRPILNFSDEEDETNERESEDDGDEILGADEDSDRRSVFYDSEENEIANPREFFEREAELSGSEFSGDEDERGLDEFDAEAGDDDDLDYNKIHSQLGKIHLRRLLDDDSRNVRLLQELLFEDGDLYAGTDQKKFKWKNLANVEEPTEFANADDKNDNAETSDEEDAEDLQTRKERLERQLLFEKMKEKGELSFDGDLFKNVFRKLKVTTVKNSLNVQPGRENAGNVADTSNLPANPSVPHNSRGSFLSRNEELLSRLAKVTAGVVDNVRGPKNSKNFVFATKSPEKAKPEKSESKRLMEEPETTAAKKKMKLSSNDGQMPSILDLLG